MKTGHSVAGKRIEYVPLAYHDHQLVNLVRTHVTNSDFCIVGPSGCGKTLLAMKFAEMLEYNVVPIILYQVRYF